MSATLQEVANYIEAVGMPALTAAGYPELAAFLPLLDKLVVLAQNVAAEKAIRWDPAPAILAAELGALATLDAEMPAGKP